MAESKTFRVIENYSHEHKFDAFKEDFLKGLNKKELREKYDIPPSVWTEWRKRLETEFNIIRRTGGRQKAPKGRTKPTEYIFKRTYKGNVTIKRWLNGKYYSYGTYPSSKVAEKVADKLVKSNWDKFVAYEMVDKYGIPHSRKCMLPRILRRDV